ncbi:MAG: CHASE2 domain-containing protein [Xenococcaceae cyanobacterium]
MFALGWLRTVEYDFYDFYLKLRSIQPPDSRIVIVGITEQDLRELNQSTLDDGTLVELIEKIKTQNPRVIGLDLHRNLPVCYDIKTCDRDRAKLATLFRNTPNLIGIETTSIVSKPEQAILAHPELAKAQRIGASELIEDKDRLVRRSYFYFRKPNQENIFSFGAAVALKYLEAEDIKLVVEGQSLKLNNTVFPKIPDKLKFYPSQEIDGYQILLNYHTRNHPFEFLSICKILDGEFSADDLRDKIVLIGAAYELSKDIWYLPNSNSEENSQKFTYGVEVHAQLISSILDAAFQERIVLKFMPGLWENAIVILLLLEPGLFIYWLIKTTKKDLDLFNLTVVQLLLILGGGWVSIILGYWLPVANFIFITLVNATIISILIYQNRHEEEKLRLEKQVDRQTKELQKALADLKKITREAVKQEKSAFFLASTAFLDHEIKNPLGLILVSSDAVTAQAYSLVESLEQNNGDGQNLLVDEETKEVVAEIISNNASIREQAKRIQDLIQLIDTQSYQKQENLSLHNIDDFLDRVWEVSWYTFNKKTDSQLKVEIIWEKSNSSEKINIYPKSLHIALNNILENGLYSLAQKSQKTNTLSLFKPRIKIKSHKTNKYWSIVIEDNGEGIKPENQQKIFQEFYSTKEKSLGLGLFITKQIIETQHHGSINLESRLGIFTRFTIKIPTVLEKNNARYS